MRQEADASGTTAFGELLREFRVRAGLSQSDLAEKAKISSAAVSALERGIRRAPYQSTLLLLDKALNLSSEESWALRNARQTARSKPVRGELRDNLKSERTTFVGRDGDIAELVELLARSRLVTVTGTGGVGKTRIAVAVAARFLGSSWNEAWFVDLAPLGDGELVASKIAHAIQPASNDRTGAIDTLASTLAGRQMLLILDNCEHVIEYAAKAADVLLTKCPDLTILATSRERLNVSGEFVYGLPSLSLPPDLPNRMEAAITYPAIDLFVQRALALAPNLRFDSANLPAVVDIVRRLGGIPLAIELTAAQVPILGVEVLRERLYEDFNVPSGRRDLPARQQTVSATIRWSFDLLSSEEQTLLCDAAIFAGGFSLESAEAVCPDDSLVASSVLPCLSSLVAKSLVNVDYVESTARYSLLESVRAFGLQKLRETARHTAVARRHSQWFAHVSDEFDAREAVSTKSAGRLLPDFDNMRSAIAWSLESPNQEDRAYAGHILTGLSQFWDYLGRKQEFRELLEIALQRLDEAQHPSLVSSLLMDFMLRATREPVSIGMPDRAIRLSEQFGSSRDQLSLHIALTYVLEVHGDLQAAERSAERAYDLLASEGLQNSALCVSLLLNRHELRMSQRRFDDARADLAQAEAKAYALGEHFLVVCHCYSRRSTLEYAVGNKQLALDFAKRMMSSEFRDNPYVAQCGLERIAMLRLELDDLDGAAEPLRELIRLMPIDDNMTHGALEMAALYLALRNRISEAAMFLGFARTIMGQLTSRRFMKQAVYDRLSSILRGHLSDESLEAAESEGARWESEEGRRKALAALH